MKITQKFTHRIQMITKLFNKLFLFFVFFILFLYSPEDLHRIRVEHMERQLANLTGLVQKALIQNPTLPTQVNPNYLGVPGQCRGGKKIFCIFFFMIIK